MPKGVAETDIPEPIERSNVTQFGVRINPTETLRSLKAGQSFLVDTKRSRAIVVSTAYRLDISIRTAKEGDKFRIWRKV